MAGIIHFQQPARRGLTRRSLMLGAAGLAAVSTVDKSLAYQGTPVTDPGAADAAARERLTALLEMAPIAAMGGPDPDQWLFAWVDLQTHFAALGVTDWRDPDVSLVDITIALSIPDNLSRYAVAQDAEDTFGFSALDASQILVVGNPPDQVTYYAGLPVDRLPGIWENAGYERMNGEYGEYWTAGQEGELDLTSPISSIGVGSLNNVAILDDDVVVFTRTARLLQQVQGLLIDGGDSVASDADLVEIIETLPDDAVNVIALPGQSLSVSSITPEGGQVTGADLLAESNDAVGPMPPLSLAVFGITAGAEARFVVRLLTESPDAASAAASVTAWRVENMASPFSRSSYSELMTLESAPDALVSGDVATLDFGAVSNIGFWNQMVYSLDLWPFAWEQEA